MNIINEAESIISTKFNETGAPISINQLSKALNTYITANSETDALLTIHITEEGLSEFVSTPLGKLWAIMAIPLTPINSRFILDSIRDLRRVLSEIKTLTDASVLKSISQSGND